MGVVLNKLANLSIDDSINFYIFVINGSYKDPLYENIERNFAALAREIGDNAIIAIGTDTEGFTTSVAKKYLGKDKSDSSFLAMLPAMLITNSHPERLSPESLRLIIPLRKVNDQFEGWTQFFHLLTEFVKGNSSEFTKKFEEHQNVLDAANKVISLKPNMFGIGLNLNELFEIWQRRSFLKKSSAKN
jgi:hypothetical protein